MSNINSFEELKQNISKAKKIIGEMNSLVNSIEKAKDRREKKMIYSEIGELKNSLRETNNSITETLKKIYLTKPLSEKKPEISQPEKIQKPEKKPEAKKGKSGSEGLEWLEKSTLKRIKQKEQQIVEKKTKKPRTYAKTANRLFYRRSLSLINKKGFQTLERDLVKANLQYTPTTYISIILFTTILSVFAGLLIFLFFLFFNFGAELPIITRATEEIGIRLLKIFWIPIVVPLLTFFMMYIYPSLEKKAIAHRIDQELPFATINMAAISGSLIDPSKIFSIILSTKEYPYLRKEFTKLINEINIHGYNFVSALRKEAFNSASKKLSELYGGLATTINSGGDLPQFFDERAKTLLFEHRLEREKYIKTAETFMDIYISIVIAAPMILMLLLMMMKISGLGIGLSTSTITLIMVMGVTLINVVFLAFLHMKKTD